MDSYSDLSESGSVELDERKEMVLKRLQVRSDERQLELSKKKDEIDKTSAKNETREYFIETFDTTVDLIKHQLAGNAVVPKDKLSEQFDELVLKHAELQKFVSDSAFFLTSHELSNRQQFLNNLLAEISSEREKFFPKKKFTFKNKKKQSSALVSQQPAKEIPLTAASQFDVTVSEFRLGDKSGQTITLSTEEVNDKDVVVSKLHNCRLVIKGFPSAIHLNDVQDSIVISTPCSRSIFIERCSNTELVLACQQLRIHEATDCSFYIHVTSKAIIEDSRGLKFAPYQLNYPHKAEDFSRAQLNISINNWADVDDFNWLVKNKQSPNWSAVPEAEWKSFALE